jgi:hypothetical protein
LAAAHHARVVGNLIEHGSKSAFLRPRGVSTRLPRKNSKSKPPRLVVVPVQVTISVTGYGPRPGAAPKLRRGRAGDGEMPGRAPMPTIDGLAPARCKTWEMKMRRSILAALFSTAITMGAAADDPLTGKLTKDQIEAITITTIARVAGSDNRCLRFHVIERAMFQELYDANIPPAMLETQELKNADALLGVIEQSTENPSD